MASQQQQPQEPSPRRRQPPQLVVVEGNISSGKSTLCRDLAARMGYEVFLEPTVANPYLELYYQEPKKYALPLQMWMLQHRFRSYLEAIKLTWDGDEDGDGEGDEEKVPEEAAGEADAAAEERPTRGILLDRSIFSDWVFAKKNFDDGNISEEGYRQYTAVRDQMLARIPFPDVVINLNVTPEECYRRVHHERQRSCESGIPLAYLQGLSECYVELVAEFQRNGVCVMDCVSDAFVECADVGDQLTAHYATALAQDAVPTSACDAAMRADIVDMLRNPPSFGLESSGSGGSSAHERAGTDAFPMDMAKIQDAEERLNEDERARRARAEGAGTTPSPRGKGKSASRTNGSPTTIVNALKTLEDELYAADDKVGKAGSSGRGSSDTDAAQLLTASRESVS